MVGPLTPPVARGHCNATLGRGIVKWFTVRPVNDAVEVAAQKKGIATPGRGVDLIKARLKQAEAHDNENDVKGVQT